MRELGRFDDDDDLWHPSGWSPVYEGMFPDARHLVGFTTLQLPIERFRLSRPSDRDDGSFLIGGEARRVLKGEFFGWIVPDGDWREMPDFWAF